ncbi:MAG: hypothetical protein N3G20_03755 [Verrucomicrobiae bacterium]|nr:hypothetical protein [Verrucomicrobiae bacterium]
MPAQTLNYRLGDGAPAGAWIDPETGIFKWRPAGFQGGARYEIAVIVTDSAIPALGATQVFSVVVLDTRPDFGLDIGTVSVVSGGIGTVPLVLHSGAELLEFDLDLKIDGNRLVVLGLTNLAAEVGGATLQNVGSDEFRLQFTSALNSTPQGRLTVGRVLFTAATNQSSGAVLLEGKCLEGVRLDGAGIEGKAGHDECM